MRDLLTRIVITAKDKTAAGIQSAKSGFSAFLEKIGLASQKTDDLAGASKKAAGEQKELDKQNQSLTKSLRQSAAALTAFIAAAFGLNKIKEGLTAILNTGGKFKILNAQLEAVMGTVEGGEAAFAWIKSFAKTTPLQLEGVTDAFIKMKAFGLDPMDGTMQKLVDQSSKLGGGQERLNGIILAVGQAWTKQKLQAEEANQLIERGVPVWELLAEKMHITTQQLIELATKGKIGREEISLLIDAIGDSSEGAAAAQMSTWNGLISNLQDTWTQFLDTIAQSGALDYFKTQLEEIMQRIEVMANNGQLQEAAQSISNFFVSTAENIKSTINFIVAFSDELKALAQAFIAVKIVGFIENLKKLGAGLLSSGTAAKALTASLMGIQATTVVIAFTISQVSGLVEKLIAAGRASRELNKTQEDYEKNTRERLKILEAEAAQLGLNTAKYKGNFTAIVDAIQAKKEEIKAAQEATEATRDFEAEVAAVAASSEKASITVEALANKTGLANSEVIRLTTSTQKIITQFTEWEQSAEGLEKSLQKISEKDLATMINDMTAAIESGINATETMKLRLNELTEESLRRMGIEVDLTKDKIQDFGIKGAANFKAVKTSANLTKEQLEQLRIELIRLAETPEQLKALKEEFQKQGESLTNTTKLSEIYRQTLEKLKHQTDLNSSSTRGLGSAYQGMSSQARAAMAPLHAEMDQLRQEAAALRNELNQAVNQVNRRSIGAGFDPKTQARVNELSPEEFAKFQKSFERIANSNTSKSSDQIVESILFGIEKNRDKEEKATKTKAESAPAVAKQVTIEFNDPRGNVHRTRFDTEEEGDNFIRMMQDLSAVT